MSGRDIEKLRHKFILIAMASIFLAMLFISSLLNLTNYVIGQREVWWTLDSLLEEGEGPLRDREPDEKRPVSFADVFALSYHRDNFYLFFYDENGEETDFLAGWMGDASGNTARSVAEEALAST